jgi:hypothetical protein
MAEEKTLLLCQIHVLCKASNSLVDGIAPAIDEVQKSKTTSVPDQKFLRQMLGQSIGGVFPRCNFAHVHLFPLDRSLDPEVLDSHVSGLPTQTRAINDC